MNNLFKFEAPKTNEVINFINGQGLFINEEAKEERFQNWAAIEVLPSLKQYGSYVPILPNPEEITSNMDEIKLLSERKNILNYHIEECNHELKMYNILYLDRFKNLEIDGAYTIYDIHNNLINKSKFISMSKEEINNLLINLGFMCIGIIGNNNQYFADTKRVISIEPLTLTLKGLIELCYAIDFPRDVYFHF